jgi:hypothetical protein
MVIPILLEILVTNLSYRNKSFILGNFLPSGFDRTVTGVEYGSVQYNTLLKITL